MSSIRPRASPNKPISATSLGSGLRTKVVVTTAAEEKTLSGQSYASSSSSSSSSSSISSSGLGARSSLRAGSRLPATSSSSSSSSSSATAAAARSSSVPRLRPQPAGSPTSHSSLGVAGRRARGQVSAEDDLPVGNALPRPSPSKISKARFDDHKAVNPFHTKRKFKTPFSEAYVTGTFPCRLSHGSVHHKLLWSCSVPTPDPWGSLDYKTLLPLCAEGLSETEHPFVFVARQAWKELLEQGGESRIAPHVSVVIQPIRKALMDKEEEVFLAAIEAVEQLSACIGPHLNPHLSILIQQIHKKAFHSKLGSAVNRCIQTLAENGGEESWAIIKAKVPTFTPF